MLLPALRRQQALSSRLEESNCSALSTSPGAQAKDALAAVVLAFSDVGDRVTLRALKERRQYQSQKVKGQSQSAENPINIGTRAPIPFCL
jgi:hypothetical protein